MTEEFFAQLEKIVSKEHIKRNESMKDHTTFRVGGPADVYISASIEEAGPIVCLTNAYEVPLTVIGAGSNLLVRDGGIRGVVMEIGSNAKNLIAFSEGEDTMLVAEAGVRLSALAQKACDLSLTGLAFASGIPGTVGGAVTMNAGAYGGEMKDVITSVTVLTPTGASKTLSREELDLSYRHSCIFEKDYIVLSATFLLKKGDAAQIRAEMSDYAHRRLDKQPLEFPSAGSTFKRPEGYFAGKLIEDAGLRGFSVGGAQVSEKHCGFVINRDHATATELLQLIRYVQKRVKENAAVDLETEVRIVGEDL